MSGLLEAVLVSTFPEMASIVVVRALSLASKRFISDFVANCYSPLHFFVLNGVAEFLDVLYGRHDRCTDLLDLQRN